MNEAEGSSIMMSTMPIDYLCALPLVGPKLFAAVLLPTETLDSIRIDHFEHFSLRVVVKGKLGVGRDIAKREERQVVQEVIVALHRRHRNQFAIRVARMVHEAGDSAELLGIHHVLALAGPIKAEQVGLVLLRPILANACLLFGNDFA